MKTTDAKLYFQLFSVKSNNTKISKTEVVWEALFIFYSSNLQSTI